MTTAGGIGHTLPFLIRDFRVAMAVAILVVIAELFAISLIRNKYMDTPFVSAALQVVVGGALVFAAGVSDRQLLAHGSHGSDLRGEELVSKPRRSALLQRTADWVQFVDLKQKGFAPAEIRRFVDRFGWEKLLDVEGKHYQDAGLKYLKVSEPELLSKIEREPKLLKLPLVRFGKHLSVGDDTKTWREMAESAP